DLDGSARTQNGRIDMGAYESDGYGWYKLSLTQSPANPVAVGSTGSLRLAGRRYIRRRLGVL
ncbi:MAG: hypothetical protein M1335_03215, partial [Chloroflexi bacterium]|nr:hypothetical protein [Chloroflexota bacterium]